MLEITVYYDYQQHLIDLEWAAQKSIKLIVNSNMTSFLAHLTQRVM